MNRTASTMEMAQRIQSPPPVSAMPSALVISHPTAAPAAPRMMVQRMPRFWSPFMKSRARAPMTAPVMMIQRMLI
nr:hypothetical protein DA06_14765 [Georgenia sp. SUBG003]